MNQTACRLAGFVIWLLKPVLAPAEACESAPVAEDVPVAEEVPAFCVRQSLSAVPCRFAHGA